MIPALVGICSQSKGLGGFLESSSGWEGVGLAGVNQANIYQARVPCQALKLQK